MPGPLDGVKILDLTSVGFGPFAAQILGDYGAEIIKIETHEGDITRGITPFVNQGMGHFFVMANRNKRCVVLDLKAEKGRAALNRTTAFADDRREGRSFGTSSNSGAAAERLSGAAWRRGAADRSGMRPALTATARRAASRGGRAARRRGS